MALKSKPLDQVRSSVPASAAALGDLVRVNLNVPAATRTAWKMAALRRNITLSDLILEAMSKHLKE